MVLCRSLSLPVFQVKKCLAKLLLFLFLICKIWKILLRTLYVHWRTSNALHVLPSVWFVNIALLLLIDRWIILRKDMDRAIRTFMFKYHGDSFFCWLWGMSSYRVCHLFLCSSNFSWSVGSYSEISTNTRYILSIANANDLIANIRRPVQEVKTIKKLSYIPIFLRTGFCCTM